MSDIQIGSSPRFLVPDPDSSRRRSYGTSLSSRRHHATILGLSTRIRNKLIVHHKFARCLKISTKKSHFTKLLFYTAQNLQRLLFGIDARIENKNIKNVNVFEN